MCVIWFITSQVRCLFFPLNQTSFIFKLSHFFSSSLQCEEKITLLTIPNVTYSQEYTTLKIETEQLTGAERTSVIGVKNLPANIEITLFPKQVKFTYEVGLSRYEESLKDNFGFFVDYNATKDGSNFLEVKATTIPDYIENLNFTPQRVEYIIE